MESQWEVDTSRPFISPWAPHCCLSLKYPLSPGPHMVSAPAHLSHPGQSPHRLYQVFPLPTSWAPACTDGPALSTSASRLFPPLCHIPSHLRDFKCYFLYTRCGPFLFVVTKPYSHSKSRSHWVDGYFWVNLFPRGIVGTVWMSLFCIFQVSATNVSLMTVDTISFLLRGRALSPASLSLMSLCDAGVSGILGDLVRVRRPMETGDAISSL